MVRIMQDRQKGKTGLGEMILKIAAKIKQKILRAWLQDVDFTELKEGLNVRDTTREETTMFDCLSTLEIEESKMM